MAFLWISVSFTAVLLFEGLDLGFERRPEPVEFVKKADPVFVLFESRPGRERPQEIAVDESLEIPSRIDALFQSVSRDGPDIVDDRNARVADADPPLPRGIEIKLQGELFGRAACQSPVPERLADAWRFDLHGFDLEGLPFRHGDADLEGPCPQIGIELL
jgi:hypothetical protein